jgi:hypothetical protein
MTDTLAARKIAIVHDWLPLYGGAERVLEQILIVFPKADVFSLIERFRQSSGFQNKEIDVFVQISGWQDALPILFPADASAVEQFDLSVTTGHLEQLRLRKGS